MGTDTTPDLTETRPELAKTLALMRLMSATGGTVSLSGPALADVLAELEASETRTEWAVYAVEDDEVIEHDTESGARFTVRLVPGTQLRSRERREYAGPWVPVEDEAGAR
jgi:hypothetical protein